MNENHHFFEYCVEFSEFSCRFFFALVAAAHEVVAVASVEKYAVSLNALGCRFITLHMENSGTNPVKDALLTVIAPRTPDLLRKAELAMLWPSNFS